MGFPLRISDQLKPHLRALRKRRGLTQSQLGALVGVKQARIAEIEAHPGTVSLDQLIKVLAVLGGTLRLHDDGDVGTDSRAEPDVRAKAARPASAGPVGAKRVSVPAPVDLGQVASASAEGRSSTKATRPSRTTSIVIRPKKGTW